MPWLLVGFGTYMVTAALGTSAQLGLVNTRPFRWLHHVLFAAIWLTIAIVLWTARGQPRFWIIGLVALCMGLLPRFKAGTRPHCAVAVIGFACYACALLWAVVRLNMLS